MLLNGRGMKMKRSVIAGFVFICCLMSPVVSVLSEESQQTSESTYPGVYRNRRGEAVIGELEFKEARIQDVIRVISELTKVNIVATKQAGKRAVTLFVRDLTVDQIVDSICRISGLWFRYNDKSGVYIVMTSEEYQKDIVVYRNEPTRVFHLKYLNVGIVARTIADLFGDRVSIEGKSDAYYGDDFSLDNVEDTSIKEDIDDGSSESNYRNSSSNLTSTVYRTSRTSRTTNTNNTIRGAVGLTNRQIALLERDEEGMQRVSEQELKKVSQRAEAPVYGTINRMHNMLFVRTSDLDAMNDIAKIIKESDRQVPEVLLEMKILRVTLDDSFQSAFDISDLSGTTQSSYPADGMVANPLSEESTSVASSLLSLGTRAATGLGSSTMVFQALSDNLRVRLELLQKNNKVDVLATPMLLAANNHPAKIFIGDEDILTTGFTTNEGVSSSGSGTIIYNYRLVPETKTEEIGTKLVILPSINADGTVVMRIAQEISTKIEDGSAIPLSVDETTGETQEVVIDTKGTTNLDGTVLAKDDMTIAVGGMVETTVTDNVSKVPILGDIPLLGFFFQNKEKKNVKTELILLITPHILTNPEQAEQISMERVNALTNHPNPLDDYFTEAVEARKRHQGNVIDLRGEDVGKNRKVDHRGDEGLKNGFVKMIKTAAVQVRQPLLTRRPVGNIKPEGLSFRGGVKLFPRDGVTLYPEAQWSDGHWHLTALKVVNRSNRMQPVNVKELKGKWKAATLEKQALAPAGKEGDSTWLYLISDKPFEKSIGGGL